MRARTTTNEHATKPPGSNNNNNKNQVTSNNSITSSSSSSKDGAVRALLPAFIYEHGRTVYGGNPVVQQTLPGWFAYLSPFSMIPIFFIFMIPFIVVGALILVQSPRLYLVEGEYSGIHKYQYIPSDPAVNINQGIRQFTANGVTHSQGTRTWVRFDIEKRMKAPVYMYYTIDNMYQNFRDFHDGRNTAQLAGKSKIGSTFLCKPFSAPGFLDDSTSTPVSFSGQTREAGDFTYNPCGLAPWSMFNDTFRLYRVVASGGGGGVIIGGSDGVTPLALVCDGTDFDAAGNALGQTQNHCSKKGISWRADAEVRFKPLTPRDDWWSRNFPHVTDNDYLNQGWYLNEPGHPLPDPSDLDFQVWMKSAVRNAFRKLYRIIDVDLEPGAYELEVEEFFDTVTFRGSKGYVLRTRHWFGDSNVAIGVVFVVMGCLSFVLGVAFSIEYVLRRRCGYNRLEKLPESRRPWYVFDPESEAFQKYYQLRTDRHIPMAELKALRTMQDNHSD